MASGISKFLLLQEELHETFFVFKTVQPSGSVEYSEVYSISEEATSRYYEVQIDHNYFEWDCHVIRKPSGLLKKMLQG